MREVFSPELAEFVETLLTEETRKSLYFQQDDLTMRGIRLSHGNKDSSVVLFI